MNLDELLDQSKPPTAPRSATLDHELSLMVAAAEASARPRRRVVRIGIVSAVAAGVFGVGTAGAMAVGIVSAPSWIPWATTAGSACEMQFTASAAGADGQPLTKHYTQAEKQQAVTEADKFLAHFNYSSIDEAAAIREWKKGEDVAIAREAPGQRQPRLTGDDLEITAVGRQVWNELATDLEAHHLPSELVVFGQGWRCKS